MSKISIHTCLAACFPSHPTTSPYSTYSILASARIQRWALLLGGYDYKISPGHQHANADMLSRLPSNSTPPEPPASLENVYVLETLDSLPVTSVHIRQWTAEDAVLAKVQDSLIAGQPTRRHNPPLPEVLG